MGMEQPPEPNENDTPDDGLAIVAVVSSVVVLIILCSLFALAQAVGLM